tara:strand:+ start:2398 stop:4092 length:1695 start_codon:yes stop_codon:yes gene_type:complete
MRVIFLFLSTYLLTYSSFAQQTTYDSLLQGKKGEQAENIIAYFNANIIKKDSSTAALELAELRAAVAKSDIEELTSLINGLRGVFYFHYVPEHKDSSIFLVKQALEAISNNVEFQLTEARLTNVLGIFQYRLLEFQHAIENILLSEYKLKQVGYEYVENIDFYLYNMGVVQFGFKQYDKAKQYILESLQYIDTTDAYALAAEYNILGVVYTRLEKSDSAILYLNKSKEIMLKEGMLGHLSASYCNLGLEYLNIKNLDQAKQCFAKAFSNAMEHQEHINSASATIGLSKVYFELKQFDSTNYWINKTEELIKAHQIKDPNYLVEHYNIQARYFDHLADYQEASRYKDSVLLKQKELNEAKDYTKVTKLNLRIIEEKHQAEISLLEEKTSNEKRVRLILIASSSLIIVLLAYLWFLSIKKRKAERHNFLEKQEQNLQKIKNFKKRIQEKNELIEEIKLQNTKEENITSKSESLNRLKDSIILTDEDWFDFKDTFSLVYPNYIPKLILKAPNLTEAELRFLVLLKLGLSVNEMSNTLAILPHSVRKTRLRLTNKLGLENYKDLHHYI